MKKLLLITVFYALTYGVHGQTRAGLKLAPDLNFNRVIATSDTLQFSSQGAGVRFIFGPVFDFPLGSSNAYFTSGLLYSPKRIGIKVEGRETPSRYQEIYKLQYLQIPGVVSFYTNEIGLDKRLYFQVGLELEIKISEKDGSPNQLFVSDFRTFNLSSVLGMGVELTQGTTTVLAIGLGYHRGLNDIASGSLPIDGSFVIKPDVLSLDFTLWF